MTTSNFYSVQPGDNLSAISQRTGVSVSELAKLNGIRNPNHIKAGHKLALTREAVCGVTIQMLDRDHNPIRNLPYVVRYSGKEVSGVTNEGGHIRQVITDSPLDTVTILLRRPEGDLKEIATVVSGYKHKLVTLVSPKLKIEAKTQPHPVEPEKPDSEPPPPSLTTTPKLQDASKTAEGTLQSWSGSGENLFGVKLQETKTASDKPVAIVTNQGLDLTPFTNLYTPDEVITAEVWAAAAASIGCEVAAIKAISRVESREHGFFVSSGLHYPIILFERHKFSKWTNQKYDADNPDISSKKRYRKKPKGDTNVSADDIYGPEGIFQFLRFKKAYLLDVDAAICACSWGKFQVMGENHKALKMTAEEFMQSAFTSERAHILKMFVPFVLTKRDKQGTLRDALVNRDWARVACLYNGRNYAENNYDGQIKDFYEKYAKSN